MKLLRLLRDGIATNSVDQKTFPPRIAARHPDRPRGRARRRTARPAPTIVTAAGHVRLVTPGWDLPYDWARNGI
jgi:hypothetical protein